MGGFHFRQFSETKFFDHFGRNERILSIGNHWLVANDDAQAIQDFNGYVSFKMADLGLLTYFLGLQVHHGKEFL